MQMELCKETLGDWLERRNKKVYQKRSAMNLQMLKDFFLTKREEVEKTLQIFEKIICGVEYIHNKENLIHRDLKPNNIFFTFDDQIKIGDLGLATNSLN